MPAAAEWITLAAADRLLVASLHGGAVIAIVWLVCRAAPRLPAAAHATVWWLACLKLVLLLASAPAVTIPLLPARAPEREPVRVGAAHERHAAAGALPLMAHASETDAPAAAAGDGPMGPAVSPNAGAAAWSARDTGAAALALVLATWLGVVIAHGVRLARSFRILRGIVARAVPVAGHEDVTRLARQLGLVALPEIRVSDEIDGPQVAGTGRPVVLLPAALTALPADEWRLALAHELMHVRRGDLALGWVPAIAERLFFFHPLARVAAREYFTAREAACDAAVIRALDVQPAAYGRLLVQLGVARVEAALSASASSSSASSLRRRLEMLQHAASTPLPRSPWLLIALLAVAMLPFELTGRAASAQSPAIAAAQSDEAAPTAVTARPAQPVVAAPAAPSTRPAPARVRTPVRPAVVAVASPSRAVPPVAVSAVAAPATPVSAVAVPAPARVPSAARPVTAARAQEPAQPGAEPQGGTAAILRAQIDELRRALAEVERSAAEVQQAQTSELERAQAEVERAQDQVEQAVKLEAYLAQEAARRASQAAAPRQVKPSGVPVDKAAAAAAGSTAALTRQIQTLTRQQQALIEQQQNLARQQERITEQQRELAEQTERLRQAIERMVEAGQPAGR